MQIQCACSHGWPCSLFLYSGLPKYWLGSCRDCTLGFIFHYRVAFLNHARPLQRGNEITIHILKRRSSQDDILFWEPRYKSINQISFYVAILKNINHGNTSKYCCYCDYITHYYTLIISKKSIVISWLFTQHHCCWGWWWWWDDHILLFFSWQASFHFFEGPFTTTISTYLPTTTARSANTTPFARGFFFIFSWGRWAP